MLRWFHQLYLYMYVMLPAVEVTPDKLSHKVVQLMLLCRLLKSREYLLSNSDASAAIVQAIHHKVHFLINSSLQACQDSSKGPIQPTALLALCCSLQILEVRTTCLSTSHAPEHCSHTLIWLPCLKPQPQFLTVKLRDSLG